MECCSGVSHRSAKMSPNFLLHVILILSFIVSSCVFANSAGPCSPLSCWRGCSLLMDLVKQLFTFLSVVTQGLWLSFSNVPSHSELQLTGHGLTKSPASESPSVCATSPLLWGSLTYIGSNNFQPCLYSLPTCPLALSVSLVEKYRRLNCQHYQ